MPHITVRKRPQSLEPGAVTAWIATPGPDVCAWRPMTQEPFKTETLR